MLYNITIIIYKVSKYIDHLIEISYYKIYDNLDDLNKPIFYSAY